MIAKKMLAHVLMVGFAAGCTVDNSDTGAEQEVVSQASGEKTATETPAATPASTPEPSPAPPIVVDGSDQLNISGAILLGPHADVPIKSAPVTRNMFANSIDNGLVHYSMDDLNWPTDGGLEGRAFVFWVEGSQVYGGHFDWLSVNQTAKTLENIYSNYLGRKPAKGQAVWFANCRLDGKERTNVAICQNPWP